MGIAGFVLKGKRLFFIGVWALGSLLCLVGVFMYLVIGLDWTEHSALPLLLTGIAIGSGIAVFVLGLLGVLRPTLIWPDKPHAKTVPQEKS